MKKLFYSAGAFATLLFAACQQENLEPAVTGGDTVTYTVQVPASMKSKAIGDDLTGQFVLTYEVYRKADIDDLDATPFYESDPNDPIEFDAQGVATINLQFVKDQDYVVLFWADDEDRAGLYNTTDLRKVSINTQYPLTANDVNAAAFAGIDNVSDCISAAKGNVKLVRPVSQINIATSQDSFTVGGKAIVLETSSVNVKGLYHVYNVYSKGVGTFVNEDTEYTEAAVPTEAFGSVNGTNYTYVAMSYVGFAPETGTTVDLDFTFTTNEGKVEQSVPNVPIKPNYRTNILGNLISEEKSYTVTLDTEWTDNIDLEFVTDGLIKNIDGDYEVSTEKGLAYAISNLFEKGGNFYLTEESYDLSGFAVNPPSIAGVTLNIYGQTPVVRKAATSFAGITIIGINTLIQKIQSNANVFISGVTVENDENAVVSLVQVVEEGAAVVISECAVKNSTETSDKIEVLIQTGFDTVVNPEKVTTFAGLKSALATSIKEIVISKPLTTSGDETIDLNGKTVKAVDGMTGNYAMITNTGTLVIKGQGTLQISAVNNRGWNAYSSVISNTVGGHLTVEEGVIIEHHGGTDMAYGIDNLTNGKGTSAITVVDGATVKSTYRAIRMFLNGIEATNQLIIKSGSEVHGTNKSVWMQDPSANANTGDLVIEEGAKLYGDVYLYVTAGSPSWPVSVSIASSALMGESTVITGNVPEGYEVVEANGLWSVTKPSDVE